MRVVLACLLATLVPATSVDAAEPAEKINRRDGTVKDATLQKLAPNSGTTPNLEARKAALTGTVTIPPGLASFAKRTLEVKLWQYDPFLADVSADLFDELVVKDFSHEAGTATKKRFALGKPNAVREDRAYYLTVFVTQNGGRTHMGERDGKRGLCKVLNKGSPKTVQMIVREVGR